MNPQLKQHFIKTLKELRDGIDAYEAIMDIIKPIPESPLLTNIYILQRLIINSLARELNDKYAEEFITWWVCECDFGRADMSRAAAKGQRLHKINTPLKLWNIIMKDKENKQ